MVVRTALLSVNDKAGLEDFARGLSRLGVEVIATAGTSATLQHAGIPTTSVAEVTGFSDAFLGGRVKTLQPALYAGLLADRDKEEHMRDLAAARYRRIDLLCLNLYQFGNTDQDEARAGDAITHIDIGGPMLLRAAALNYRHVAVVTRPAQYADVLHLLHENEGGLPERFLARLGSQAFALVASYEAAVSAWYTERYAEASEPEVEDHFKINWTKCSECAGAVASADVDRCLRHLEPSERRRVLQVSDEIDLRNVQVARSLLDEVLDAVSGRDGRPQLGSLRCEWAQFEGAVDFKQARVRTDADFGGARFSGPCRLEGLTVRGELRCRNARFRAVSLADLHVEGLATFRGADLGDADFARAGFAGPAVFEGAYFAGDTSFADTRFDRDASFIGATFEGVARFEATRWRGGSRFRDAKFSSPPVCSDPVRFQEATWPEHPGVADGSPRTEASGRTGRVPSPRVFIASSAESLGVAQAIQVHLDHAADPVVWSQGVFAPGGTNLGSLQDELERSDFGVFVLAADDALEIRGQRLGAPRGNVLIEIGLCVATLGVERTFLMKPRHAQVAVPNDLDGIVVVDYDESREDPISATGAASTQMARVIESRGRRAG